MIAIRIGPPPGLSRSRKTCSWAARSWRSATVMSGDAAAATASSVLDAHSKLEAVAAAARHVLMVA